MREIKKLKHILFRSHFRSIVFVFRTGWVSAKLAKNNSLVYLSTAYLNEWRYQVLSPERWLFDLAERNLHWRTTEPKLPTLSRFIPVYAFPHWVRTTSRSTARKIIKNKTNAIQVWTKFRDVLFWRLSVGQNTDIVSFMCRVRFESWYYPNTFRETHLVLNTINCRWGLADFSGLQELNTELNFFHKYRSTIYCKLITAGRLHYYTIKRKGLWQHGQKSY